MMRPGWMLWIGLLLWQSQVLAHDLGVSQASLSERPDNNYQLRVETTSALASLFQTPRLPERCSYLGEPGGQQAAGALLWGFRCAERPLTSDDELFLPWQREGVMLAAHWADGSQSTSFFPRQGDGMAVGLAQLEAGSGSLWSAAKRYLSLGVEHIALGIDHLLFVLCLLLVVQGIWPLVKTITAFTLAHSITLGLATLGFVQFSPAPVEASIALSIVFLAAEVLRRRHAGGYVTVTYRAPWLIAFGFGLLHGLGFAGALADLGLPQKEIPIALLFFNIGVELGQLLFVGVILLVGYALHWLGQQQRDLLTRVTAYGIGGLAAFWFLQRSAAIFTI